ncbi:HD-GYP domain-containing protein [Cohnella silvisoli]|uniref:HD-GYP domain-containing protein n=1 Tax=Cohnella silvisoli TaxID=2873699 RepID=A0ABV1KS13_9BACL|nr:HD-GYP domain-containing protein [Cohnella silvisoli]MCD9022568.1 HD-GYP domain-containing protein [Cohnella silvisoli]
MIIVPIAQCLPGMRLGKAVISESGHVMLGYHVKLSQLMITKLIRMGIDYLYIEDEQTEDIPLEDSIREETRALLRRTLLSVYAKFSITSSIRSTNQMSPITRMLFEGMSRVIEDLSYNKRNLVSLMTQNVAPATRLEQHFCQNAINVCVYSTKLAMLQGYSKNELFELGLGALLHDIGNIQIPPKLLLSSSNLTTGEYAEVKKHTEIGFNMLKENTGIPLLAATCALQHHERIDGSGYPFKLRDTQIHDYARWIGLLDSYDAMTHPRAYRNSIAPHHALEILYANAGSLYDIKKVTLFRNKVAIFPVGLSVKLSTGERGVICRQNQSIPSRPVVRILQNEREEKLKTPYEINLSTALHVMIDNICRSTVTNK